MGMVSLDITGGGFIRFDHESLTIDEENLRIWSTTRSQPTIRTKVLMNFGDEAAVLLEVHSDLAPRAFWLPALFGRRV